MSWATPLGQPASRAYAQTHSVFPPVRLQVTVPPALVLTTDGKLLPCKKLSLEAFQAAVDGYVEPLRHPDFISRRLMVLVNEDARLHGTRFPVNATMSAIYGDAILGHALFTALDDDGEEHVPLSPAQGKWIRKRVLSCQPVAKPLV